MSDVLKSVNKEYKPYFKELLAQGWTIEITSKKVKLRSPNNGLVTCSITPSCQFALQHVKGDVRRLERKEAELLNQRTG